MDATCGSLAADVSAATTGEENSYATKEVPRASARSHDHSVRSYRGRDARRLGTGRRGWTTAMPDEERAYRRRVQGRVVVGYGDRRRPVGRHDFRMGCVRWELHTWLGPH